MKLLNGRIGKASLALLTAGSFLVAGAGVASAQALFGSLDKEANAQVRFSGAERGTPIIPGSEVSVAGQGFKAGQAVKLLFGATPIPGGDLVADAEGKVAGKISVPATAASGSYPIVVVADAPYNASVSNLKVSPDVPLSGQQNYTITEVEPGRGLYQAAYSSKNNTVFITSAVGRPPVQHSELIKVDADSLKVLARITPAEAPAPQRPAPAGAQANAPQGPGVYAVYGVGVDDSRGTVWVTNTRQNTIAVYNQADLSLVKQFPVGAVAHARDVVVAPALNKAYSGATGTENVHVFSTESLEATKAIAIKSGVRGQSFSVGSLALDTKNNRLYTVSLSTNEVAVINTTTDEVEKVMPVPGAAGAIGVSFDAQTGRIFVASQGSDNLVVLDGNTGKVIADTPVGAGALNVTFDPVKRRAYVSNRGANTIAVTDADGKIVANLGPAPFANHATVGKAGTIYAVDKSSSAGKSENDTLLRIRPRR